MKEKISVIKEIEIPIVLQVVFMLVWAVFLVDSESYYVPYLIMAFLALLCTYVNYKEKRKPERSRLITGSSLFFSFLMVTANYNMFLNAVSEDFPAPVLGNAYKIIMLVLVFLGGYFAAKNILSCAEKKVEGFCWKYYEHKASPVKLFIIVFLLISALNTLLLFLAKYPGIITYDSLEQMSQNMTGVYTNHHPVSHTLLIKFVMDIGMQLFGEINAAIAVYHVFQIMFMAMCFSMTLYTLYEMHISFKAIVITVAWYTLMPFHIIYSFTMWKDVMFGGFVLLFLVFIFRIFKEIGKHKRFNYIMLSVSSLGVCLFRSNGLFVFAITAVWFIIAFRKTNKKIGVLFLGVLAVSLIVKYPVLGSLGIQQPDALESLSIPIHQVSRVVKEYDDFTDEQRELLSQVVDIPALREQASTQTTDPAKALIRAKEGQKYIEENKSEFIKLYMELGLKHPDSYVKAWIDGTKGYWNGGYEFWRWADCVWQNSYGMQRTVNSEFMGKCLDGYLWIFSNNRFLQLFLCIGVYVWLVLFFVVASVIRKDRLGVFMTVPLLANVLSLMIASPVFAEFRYAYAIFCAVPFMIFALFYRPKE